jgi:hypothetical protein
VTKSVTASPNHPYGCQLPYSVYSGPTGGDYGSLLRAEADGGDQLQRAARVCQADR